MTLNGVMAVILRYFTELGSFRDALRKSDWRCHRTKVRVRYRISWWEYLVCNLLFSCFYLFTFKFYSSFLIFS